MNAEEIVKIILDMKLGSGRAEILKAAELGIVQGRAEGEKPLASDVEYVQKHGELMLEEGKAEGRKEGKPICCICEKHIGTACDFFEKGIIKGRRELAVWAREHSCHAEDFTENTLFVSVQSLEFEANKETAKAVDTSVSQPIGKAEVSRLEPHHSEPPKASNLPAADIPKSISAPQGFDTHVGSWKRTTFLVVAARLRKGDFGEIEMAKHD
jgi:hypothetical protein